MAGAIAFFNHDSRVLNELFEALQSANARNRTMRFETGSTEMPDGSVRNWLKFKVGEDMWSPPFYEDVDPYRDRS